jgi:DNA-directed RNA polymerase specialized sigma24 family protein
MTPQIRQTADKHIESELDRLTYSAYLLTLDPGVAVSVVMTAIRGSLEEITSAPDLLERTVELALEQLDRESRMEGDGESSAFDAALCREDAAINSPTFQSLKDLSGNPILLLDSTSRIAFVLHHVLGYKLGEAAAKTQMDEAEYRAQLRKAYLRLASVHSEEQVSGGKFLEEPALA